MPTLLVLGVFEHENRGDRSNPNPSVAPRKPSLVPLPRFLNELELPLLFYGIQEEVLLAYYYYITLLSARCVLRCCPPRPFLCVLRAKEAGTPQISARPLSVHNLKLEGSC
jgi:hypothetical protein